MTGFEMLLIALVFMILIVIPFGMLYEAVKEHKDTAVQVYKDFQAPDVADFIDSMSTIKYIFLVMVSPEF